MFYNPAMAIDRDLAVAVLRAFRDRGEGPRQGWEMTAATGVRGLRLVREAGPFDAFTLTESHPAAFELLARNAAEVAGTHAVRHDARDALGTDAFDLVDLDPYGSPIPFVPSAVTAIRTGGLLAVTATDLMVLAGAQPRACRERYRAVPVRGRLGPEGGLRILLAYLAVAARLRHRRLRPRLGYVGEHHVRVYVSVLSEGSTPDPIGPIDPARWEGPPVGTGGPYGPMWLGPLFDADLVRALSVPPTAERPRELGALLERFREEASVDVPFYYEANSLARTLHLREPPALARLLGAIREAGYRAGPTHVRPGGFRTDAPRPDVEALARRLPGR